MLHQFIEKAKAMLLSEVKKSMGSFSEQEKKYNNLLSLFSLYVNRGFPRAHNFSFTELAQSIFRFVDSMQTDKPFSYRYAPSTSKATIYGSAYACMLFFLLGRHESLTQEKKADWASYFDSFQNPEGFFIDPLLECDNYYNLAWWGAHHLSLHMIICYTYLGRTPRYEFNYIKKYYDSKCLKSYLESLDFDSIKETDTDNAIMNLGALLQYQRDFFKDGRAAQALENLFIELEKRINPRWGSWGYGRDDDMVYLSRAQQFAYHLYPLWFYDKKPVQYPHQLIDLSLKTQTALGGFGAYLASSACEDIDCMDLLIKLAAVTDYRKADIELAMLKALPWVFTNQNEDGGFVFRRNEPFVYGHALTSSRENESHLFATWFRLLSIAYAAGFFKLNASFTIGRCPGMQF